MQRIDSFSPLKQRLIVTFGLVLAIAVILLAALPFLAARQIDITTEARTKRAMISEIELVRDLFVDHADQIAMRNAGTGRLGVELDPLWQQQFLWKRNPPISQLSALLLIDATGRILQSETAPGVVLGDLGPTLRTVLRQPPSERPRSGFARIGDRLFLVAHSPVGMEDRLVVLVRALDKDFLDTIELLGQVENVAVAFDVTAEDGLLLPGVDGGPIGGLTWTRHGTIARMVDQALEFSLVVVLALAVLAGIFIRNANELFAIMGRFIAGMLRSESALAAQLDFLQTLIDSLPDPVSYKDVDGRYLGCNEAFCRWVGRPKDQIVGCKVGDIFAPGTTEAVLRRDARLLAESALAGTATQRDEAVLELSDGRFCEVISTRAAFRDGDGRLAGLVHSIIDISDLKRQQAELKAAKETADAAHEAKSNFLATMSHELRTPLNGIIGMVQVLDGTRLSKQQREFIRLIGSSGEWLLTILNDILDLSKLESGRLELDCVDFEVRSLVEGLIGFMSATAERKGITVECEVSPDVPEAVAGDPARLRQILLNLIGNAVKFTERGKVRCEVRSLPSPPGAARLHFVISDTGIGIPTHAMKRLFEPFTQADSSVARKYGGTGLGLAICKKFVSAMGGFITVESNVGVGTAFRVVLEFLNAQQEGVASPFNRVVPGPFSVLLAEDNEVNQLVAKLLLERLGHRVATAVNGLEVLAAMEHRRFDVILMDIQMAEMDGVETTRRIRALPDPQKSAIPIIAMTANISDDMKGQFAAAGMNGFLGKPFMEEELSMALADAVGERTPVPGPLLEDASVTIARDKPLLDTAVVNQIAEDLGASVLATLIRTFRQASANQLTMIEARLKTRDFEAIARQAHTLVSSAGNLGMIALSETARRLEKAALQNEVEEVERLAAEIAKLHADSLARLDMLAAVPQLT